MTMKHSWKPGAKGVCMRCGFKYLLSELSKEWTGSRVCGDCWDKKPEALKPPRVRPEGIPKKNASPEPEDNFVTTNEIGRDDL